MKIWRYYILYNFINNYKLLFNNYLFFFNSEYLLLKLLVMNLNIYIYKLWYFFRMGLVRFVLFLDIWRFVSWEFLVRRNDRFVLFRIYLIYFSICSVLFYFFLEMICDFSEFVWGKKYYILELNLWIGNIMSKMLPKYLVFWYWNKQTPLMDLGRGENK